MEKQIIDITPIRITLVRQKRVAAYARVSCDKDTMLHSLAAQIDYYRKYITRNPEWEFVGVYADEAKTGTKEDREQFQKLLSDCRLGLIDMVIAKSISRFARNTVTLLGTVRELKELGINVFFEDQGINSISEEGELMLTLMASQAQEESLSCSENCKWRIRKKFAEGIPNTFKIYGYDVKKGELQINQKEAVIIKMIFDDYLSGMGRLSISNKLNALGIKTKNGRCWNSEKIQKILKNEKYAGDLLLQKSYKSELGKKKRINNGILPQYLVRENHEAIIEKDVFERVQIEFASRKERFKVNKSTTQKYSFTGKITCGICGKNYRRKTTPYNIVWCCSTFNTRGKDFCASKVIPEETLKKCIAKALGGNTFTEDYFTEMVEYIIAEPKNIIRLILTDGTESEIVWKDRSRSESWTEEMREAARKKELERNAAKK